MTTFLSKFQIGAAALPQPAAIPALTIGEALARYHDERAPIVAYAGKIAQTIAALAPLHPLDASDQVAITAGARRWTADLRDRGRSDGTARRALITLRAALNRAWTDGLLRYPPHVEMPPAPPHRQRWLKPEEVRELLDWIGCPETSLACRLLLLTGARLGAIAGLRWSQVDFALRVVDLRPPGDDRFAARRKHRAIVPMSTMLESLLRRQRDLAEQHRRARPTDRVLRIGAHKIQRRIKWAAGVAGLRSVTAHTFRHTAATWLIGEGGFAIADVAAMLGHKSILTTQQVYAHVGAVHLRDEAEFLAKLLAAPETVG